MNVYDSVSGKLVTALQVTKPSSKGKAKMRILHALVMQQLVCITYAAA